MALFMFILDMRKEDGGVFAVHHGLEPEEIYAALLADPPPTFRAVRIYRRKSRKDTEVAGGSYGASGAMCCANDVSR